MAIPRQEETNFDDPSERFLWALRGIEFNGMPVAIPEKVLRGWSRHLSACGFVHDPALQEIHYQPPVRGQDHDLNTSGKWIPVDEPIQEPLVPTASLMTAGEKAKMIEEFREEGLID
ncbi:DUF2744 domain-containing protein [Corynebacterium coyleae]|uniref:phage gene 29 protein family protein n=1 Tax=Corynebacterium coyleae TaxID=53374 RepID=UPI001CCDE3D8|nr:DUF2744 domain-containing protein [Corynebacterium coyleae]UBI10057.1 DUF2744 domain-containing protein [Corynebacterium coyleae]